MYRRKGFLALNFEVYSRPSHISMWSRYLNFERYIADDTDLNLRTSEIIEYKSHIRVNVDREGELFFCDVSTYLMNLVTTTVPQVS